jgi:hypothetical protein
MWCAVRPPLLVAAKREEQGEQELGAALGRPPFCARIIDLRAARRAQEVNCQAVPRTDMGSFAAGPAAP